MSGTKTKVEDPCQNCRDRHLKCDDNRPRCRQCERFRESCIRGKSRLKFRYGSSARYDANFKKDQTWLEQSKNGKIQFVDQTPELENYYAQDDYTENVDATQAKPTDSSRIAPTASPKVDRGPSAGLPHAQFAVQNVLEAPASTPQGTDASLPTQKRRKQNMNTSDHYTQSDRLTYSPSIQTIRSPSFGLGLSSESIVPAQGTSPQFSTPSSSTQAVEAEYRRLADSAAAAVPSVSSGLLLPEVWKKQFFWPNAYTTNQCACLMRFYVEKLAPWFDVSDPARHFSLVIPQRARRCPPLLNAIFTAAARHLARLQKYKTSDGVIVYHGVTLQNLTSESAIKYHNACIAYLIELSKDQEHVKDENLLAAAVILRYYEELDTSLTGEDTEIFLGVFQVFINAQASNAFSPPPHSPWVESGQSLWLDKAAKDDMVSSRFFRHAAFRIALRQEITSAFMKQRSIRLPLEAWSSLRSFDDAEDAVWTDRLVIFCVDVLQFCFGEDNLRGRNQVERWNELRNFEALWELHKPSSFGAIHYREADRAAGEVFPQIWYLAECQVSGMQYLDLARILLTVYDPTVPRLGPGATAARRRTSAEIQKLVLRLCGIAFSNRTSQPALVMAQMAIAVCGEYFTDPAQQRGMIDLLVELELEHAYPTSRIVADLKQAWMWDV